MGIVKIKQTDLEFLFTYERKLWKTELKQEEEIKKEFKVKKLDSFEIEDEIYFGNFDSLLKEYCLRKPSKPFRIWLIDNGYKSNLTIDKNNKCFANF